LRRGGRKEKKYSGVRKKNGNFGQGGKKLTLWIVEGADVGKKKNRVKEGPRGEGEKKDISKLEVTGFYRQCRA